MLFLRILAFPFRGSLFLGLKNAMPQTKMMSLPLHEEDQNVGRCLKEILKEILKMSEATPSPEYDINSCTISMGDRTASMPEHDDLLVEE